MAKQVKVGDVAPDFRLESQSGSFGLKDMLGEKDVVLYFYPKDNTPGCTTEAMRFRYSYEVFKDLGAEVIGISSDSVGSHRDFASKCNLPFTILSDSGGKVRRLYGVPSSLGLLPGRVTYVIDRKGVVRYVFSSQFNPAKHVEEAVRVLREIRSKESRTA
jgi:peroxiredoxin Q/BCP